MGWEEFLLSVLYSRDMKYINVQEMLLLCIQSWSLTSVGWFKLIDFHLNHTFVVLLP